MHESATQHLTRIRQATVGKLGRKDLAQWIEKNTFIGGKPFSFNNHEYQHQILKDDAPELVIRKSAQTGISEMALRAAAGLVMIMPGAFRIGYILPTATFAADYAKTRFNPIVQGSPALRNAISSDDVDKADIKTFGQGKEIYFKGAATGNAAISTTLDMLIIDERAFADPEVVGDYTSRLIHSQYKWTISLSTPTYPGDPIDEAFTASKRHFNFCRCSHCGHRFVPDYYEHVRVPGWDKHLDEISKDNLHLLDYQKAQMLCPKCVKPVSLQVGYREWVCENPTENHRANGYQVSPFDAPNVVTLSDLIIASTKYANKAKFRQFSLGRPAADAESGLTEEDIERIGIQIAQSPFQGHVMGIDLGLTCHFMVAGVANDNSVVVVHSERVPLRNFRERYAALKTQYRVSIVVSDIQPYTDLIMSMSEHDPNLYGASYIARGGMEVYDVRRKDDDPDNALAGVRQVAINRNALFDRVMAEIRPADESADPGIWIAKSGEWELIKAHLTDMKRATAALRNGEFTTMWQKSSKGKDHYHHTLGYVWVAAQMRGVAVGMMGAGVPMVSSFRIAPKVK